MSMLPYSFFFNKNQVIFPHCSFFFFLSGFQVHLSLFCSCDICQLGKRGRQIWRIPHFLQWRNIRLYLSISVSKSYNIATNIYFWLFASSLVLFLKCSYFFDNLSLTVLTKCFPTKKVYLILLSSRQKTYGYKQEYKYWIFKVTQLPDEITILHNIDTTVL